MECKTLCAKMNVKEQLQNESHHFFLFLSDGKNKDGLKKHLMKRGATHAHRNDTQRAKWERE